MTLYEAVVYALIILFAFLAWKKRKLTAGGAVTGALLAAAIYTGAGATGLLLLATFFLLGSWATAWKREQKRKLVEEEGPRTGGQVLANGGLAAILSFLIVWWPANANLLMTMLAASFSSATADTVSSELGMLYGRRFYNVISFKKDIRGENGVISVEGTVLGMVGSMLIAAFYSITFDPNSFFLIVMSGTVGNFADSVLGATMERRRQISNNTVNFLNTLIAALVAALSFL